MIAITGYLSIQLAAAATIAWLVLLIIQLSGGTKGLPFPGSREQRSRAIHFLVYLSSAAGLAALAAALYLLSQVELSSELVVIASGSDLSLLQRALALFTQSSGILLFAATLLALLPSLLVGFFLSADATGISDRHDGGAITLIASAPVPLLLWLLLLLDPALHPFRLFEEVAFDTVGASPILDSGEVWQYFFFLLLLLPLSLLAVSRLQSEIYPSAPLIGRKVERRMVRPIWIFAVFIAAYAMRSNYFDPDSRLDLFSGEEASLLLLLALFVSSYLLLVESVPVSRFGQALHRIMPFLVFYVAMLALWSLIASDTLTSSVLLSAVFAAVVAQLLLPFLLRRGEEPPEGGALDLASNSAAHDLPSEHGLYHTVRTRREESALLLLAVAPLLFALFALPSQILAQLAGCQSGFEQLSTSCIVVSLLDRVVSFVSLPLLLLALVAAGLHLYDQHAYSRSSGTSYSTFLIRQPWEIWHIAIFLAILSATVALIGQGRPDSREITFHYYLFPDENATGIVHYRSGDKAYFGDLELDVQDLFLHPFFRPLGDRRDPNQLIVGMQSHYRSRYGTNPRTLQGRDFSLPPFIRANRSEHSRTQQELDRLFTILPEGKLVSQNHYYPLINPATARLQSEGPYGAPRRLSRQRPAVLGSWVEDLYIRPIKVVDGATQMAPDFAYLYGYYRFHTDQDEQAYRLVFPASLRVTLEVSHFPLLRFWRLSLFFLTIAGLLILLPWRQMQNTIRHYFRPDAAAGVLLFAAASLFFSAAGNGGGTLYAQEGFMHGGSAGSESSSEWQRREARELTISVEVYNETTGQPIAPDRASLLMLEGGVQNPAEILESPGQRFQFNPVQITGEPMSILLEKDGRQFVRGLPPLFAPVDEPFRAGIFERGARIEDMEIRNILQVSRYRDRNRVVELHGMRNRSPDRRTFSLDGFSIQLPVNASNVRAQVQVEGGQVPLPLPIRRDGDRWLLHHELQPGYNILGIEFDLPQGPFESYLYEIEGQPVQQRFPIKMVLLDPSDLAIEVRGADVAAVEIPDIGPAYRISSFPIDGHSVTINMVGESFIKRGILESVAYPLQESWWQHLTLALFFAIALLLLPLVIRAEGKTEESEGE